jgi:hypothetical protein
MRRPWECMGHHAQPSDFRKGNVARRIAGYTKMSIASSKKLMIKSSPKRSRTKILPNWEEEMHRHRHSRVVRHANPRMRMTRILQMTIIKARHQPESNNTTESSPTITILIERPSRDTPRRSVSKPVLRINKKARSSLC